MRGIRQAPVGKRVGKKQVTEFIMHHGFRHRQDRQDGRARCQGKQPHQQHRKPWPPRQASEEPLGGAEPSGTKLGVCDGGSDRDHN